MTHEESNLLKDISDNKPERLFSFVAELCTKYYQNGFDAGVNESIKNIRKLIPESSLKTIYKIPAQNEKIVCNKAYVKGGRVYNCICGECF